MCSCTCYSGKHSALGAGAPVALCYMCPLIKQAMQINQLRSSGSKLHDSVLDPLLQRAVAGATKMYA